jgi:copper transport protein
MIVRYNASLARRLLLCALPLAMCLVFFFPVPGEAHAILLSSDPAKDALLLSPPPVVHMQFSEDLSPTLSTAAVVNAANRRVDQNDAHISPDNSREMDISLKRDLPSDIYVVVWQTQSADDGHVLRGSFLFKVLAANGNIPSLNGTYPGEHALGGANTNSGLYTGQMDGPTLFSLIMVVLVDLSAVFWVGAQLWCTFVSQPPDDDLAEQYAIDQSADQRFERFSIPTLLVAFIANLGVLVGQGLLLTGGNFVQVFPLFSKLMSGSRFGTFWTMREIIILLALMLAAYVFWSRKRPPIIDEIISWLNLPLGLALLTALALSGHAASATSNILVYAILGDWLHLLAASLWIGGMMYLAVIYLPVLKGESLVKCTRALLTTLPHFSLLAITGVVIMALTGPFNAVVHLSTLDQLITTAYGRALLVKGVCVGALLLTSAIHVLFFRPRLNKTFDAYLLAQAKDPSEAESSRGTEDIQGTQDTGETEEAEAGEHLKTEKEAEDSTESGHTEEAEVGEHLKTEKEAQDGTESGHTEEAKEAEDVQHLESGEEVESATEAGETEKAEEVAYPIPQEVKELEESVAKQTKRLIKVLRWEPVLGIAVLICTGLMNVFAGTLQPVAAQQNQPQTIQEPGSHGKPFNTTAQTTDGKFKLKLAIAPNSFGTNLFTVNVLDSNGKQDTNVGVSVYLTMLDMDMGTDTVNLQPNDKGGFGAEGDLSMPGNWQMRLQVRTLDNNLHEATLKFFAPYAY